MKRGRSIAMWWLVGGLALVAACASDQTTPTTESGLPPQLVDHAIITVMLDQEPWRVAVADNRSLRATGLMHVEDLGDLDGMLFVFEDDTDAEFHMKDTLIPLDIAFFDAAGKLVSMTTMVPCEGESCPDYEAAGLYRFAVEARAGALAELGADSTLDIGSAAFG